MRRYVLKVRNSFGSAGDRDGEVQQKDIRIKLGKLLEAGIEGVSPFQNEINTAMPQHVVNRVGEALNSKRKPINGSKILLLGLAYKPNVDDLRESPTFILLDLLKQRGADVAYYDPHIPTINPTREHAH